MPRLPFLDYKLPMYAEHLASWQREERRLHGGDAVLVELVRWIGETDAYFTARTAQAGYLTFPKIHASTLTGHLSGQTPMPEFGKLGEVQERAKIKQPTLAELLWYNVDGIGSDGTELIPWFDGVQERAIATGYRWIMVEKPSRSRLAQIRAARGTGELTTVASTNGAAPDNVTLQDILDGFRPFPVEYSPISVPFFQKTDGRLDFAVIRIPITPDSLVDAGGSVTAAEEGYYLLVRRGFTGLGTQWAQGGWWKFNAGQDEVDRGTWDQTDGLIPLFQFIGEPSTGTTERPAIARSLTMELGQIAVSLMNRISERNYNASQAAKSINWILGIKPEQHAETISQLDDGSIVVGVPPVLADDGSVIVPQMWNSSAALLDSQAFASIIEGGISEARELMVRQLTSTPDSSGRSKEAGFAEATSPLLARLAATRQQAINSFLYFAAQRFGIAEPTASVTIPREFDLAPVVDEIDAMLATLKQSDMRSPTWSRHLVMLAGDERGLLPEDQRAKIEAEMAEGAAEDEQARVQERSLMEELDDVKEEVEA